jgi:hypothetical protein
MLAPLARHAPTCCTAVGRKTIGRQALAPKYRGRKEFAFHALYMLVPLALHAATFVASISSCTAKSLKRCTDRLIAVSSFPAL